MKKTFLSIFVTLAMCLCLTCVASAAEPAGDALTADVLGSSYTLSSGSYYLSDDLMIKQTIKVTGEVTLDLNGHVLMMNSSVYGGTATGSVIEVNTTGKLTLKDSAPNTAHYVYAQSGSDLWRWDADAEDAAQQPANTDERTYHTVKGGIITGGSWGNGGGILVAGGSIMDKEAVLTMEGGSIIGCTSNYGGGVYIGEERAKFTMSGGVIAGCAASFEGGGVAVHGATTFAMSGGKIHDCAVPRLESQNYGRGGGVYSAGTFTMKGGSIENCRVYTKTQSLTGTAEGGGGVYSAGTFTMTGGKIVSCATTEGSGDGILLSEGKTLAGVATPYTLKTADGYVDLTQRYCGNVTYAPCTHERANSDQKCAVCGVSLLAEVQSNGVTTHIANNASSISDLKNALANSKTTLVKLLVDVTSDASWSFTSPNLTLDLNGHDLTGTALTVNSGSSVTVKSSAEGGELNLNTLEVEKNGALKLESGTVTVSNSTDPAVDGKITVKGAMTVSGGSIMGNTGNDICAENGGELTITDGTVKSAIRVSTGGNLTVSGGSITSLTVDGGSATITGGSITSLTVNGGSVQLSGGVFTTLTNNITDDKAVDLLRGGYAYYNCTVDEGTGAVTRGALVSASDDSLTGENTLFTVDTHTCAFTEGEGNWTCACGRSIAGTQTPVQYLDEDGAPQYRADYTVLDNSYVSSKAEASNSSNISTSKILPLNADHTCWYYLKESLTINEDCTVLIPYGYEVHIILADGVEVKMGAGLFGDGASQLRIYAQSTDSNMGELSLGGSGLSAASRLTINGGKITVNATSGRSLADNKIADVYTNALTINGGSLTVERPANATAITETTATYYGICSGVGVRNNGLTVNGGSLTVRVPNAGADEVYGIRADGDVTLNGGTVTITAPESANVRNLSANNLTVNGGTMKLKESDLGKPVTVSNDVELADLLAEGQAYWKQVGEMGSFLKLADLTSPLGDANASYSIKTCIHSTTNGVCEYCGKDFTPAPDPAPTPSTPSTPSGGSGGSSNPTYTVTAPKTDNGSVSVTPKNAKKGASVTITVTPDKGYTLETLTVLDRNGNEIELTDNGDGTYSFKMPAGKVEIKTTFAEDNSMLNFFSDVIADSYYYDAVLWAARNGITGGIDENHFGPGLSCTRAQLVTFLWRAAGCPVVNFATDFTDVGDGYYTEAIRWAASLGIVGGYGSGLFGTDDTITREQFVTILYRFAKNAGMDVSIGEDTNILSYGDVLDVSEYAAEAFQWAVGAGIVQGNNGNLMPGQPCTRAQIVTMLYRLLGE